MVQVETEGETRTRRMLWSVMLGDLVSLQLAARRGVDPGPIELLDRLKEELGRPGDLTAYAAAPAADASPSSTCARLSRVRISVTATQRRRAARCPTRR